MAKLMDIVEKAMTYGVGRTELLRLMLQEHKLPERTTEEYMARVRAMWKSETEDERPERKARQLRRLYRQLMELQDRREYAEVAKRERLIAEIEGNLAPEEIEIVRRVGWQDMSPEQVKFIIENRGKKLPPGVTYEALFALK
jgi:hypothetical protein